VTGFNLEPNKEILMKVTLHTADGKSYDCADIPGALATRIAVRHVTEDDGEVGRPTDNPKTERCDVRLTGTEKKKFLALGGSEWLRRQLKKF
jgi:hypothetical protein